PSPWLGLWARGWAAQSRPSVRPSFRCPRLVPGAGLPAGLLVEEDGDGPDLLLGEEVLPGGHRGVPGRALARQARAALGDAPEDEALGELSDGAVVLEVERRRVERVRVVAAAVEPVAVAGQAVLVVDPFAELVVLGDRAVGAQRVLEPGERHGLAAERDLAGRRRVDRAQVGRRRDAGPHAVERDEADEQRDGDQQRGAHELLVRVDHGRADRLPELAPPRLVVA